LNYLKGWFFIDFISVIPFDLIMMYGQVNRIARISRITKLYKIIRMSKMIRLAKFGKIRTKLFKNFSEVMQITAGLDNLLFCFVLFFLLIHIIACFWIFIGRFDENSKDNWIYSKNMQDFSDYDLYVTSFYFSVTTIVTVGYGDITAISSGEKLVAVFLMVIGVIAFSYATGALGNIINNIDSSEAKLREKMTTLNDLNNEYKLDTDLYNKLVKALRFDHSKSSKDAIEFMSELPHKLKIQLATCMHLKMYSSVHFLSSRKSDSSFIAWVGTVIHPFNIPEHDYIFKE